MVGSRAGDLLTAPKGLQLLDLISQRRAADLTDDELVGLLPQLDFHVSRYRGDYEPYVDALKSRAPQLGGVAEWLPRRLAHWWDDLDRKHQIWVGRSPDAPAEDRLVVDLSPFGSETPKPKRAFWTSTFIPAATSPWLLSHEGQFSGPHYTWEVTVTDSARVLEIHSRDAWSAFARSYPRAEAGFTYTTTRRRPQSAARLDPDWSELSRYWDGVHLSIGGWLTAEDVPYESNGVTTELRGWEMESTVWLRWAFSSVERIETLER
ncbi:MAG: hypothetical protein M3082_19400 [Candidatus Dormibacteraeota bacterium]|nr:hypothetical protein [Candidatus Dormibacteraeota bacterium]